MRQEKKAKPKESSPPRFRSPGRQAPKTKAGQKEMAHRVSLSGGVRKKKKRGKMK
jgi:hypothetical protein